MKSNTLSLGWRNFFTERIQKREVRFGSKVEKDALCYDAYSNRYSISHKSISPNLFYSMELGARVLIEAWPFFNNRLLDIGCGEKPYALLINSLVRKYIGLDLPSSSSESYSDIHANGLSLPVRTESFHTVLSIDMLDEVSSPLQLLHEANQALKQDGYLILMVSNQYNVFRKETTYAQYTADGLRYLAEKSGFNVVLMRTKGKLIPFFFNLTVQFLYRVREKFAKYTNPNGDFHSFKTFNSFMVTIQKFMLKLTPKNSIRTDVVWEDSRKKHIIFGSFHLGYLMVAKKVFNVENGSN